VGHVAFLLQDTAANRSNIVAATAIADTNWPKQTQMVDTALAIFTCPKTMQLPNRQTRRQMFTPSAW
jgi:hypothetical protein